MPIFGNLWEVWLDDKFFTIVCSVGIHPVCVPEQFGTWSCTGNMYFSKIAHLTRPIP